MTDPGLNQRLRQRSRRAGFMIGISMALTIAVCVAGFSFIYAALDDVVGDFISRDVPEPSVPTEIATEESVAQAPADTNDEPEPEAQPTTEPTTEPTEEPAATSGEFVPDYQTSSNASLNFRSEPSTAGGEDTIITTLPQETALQYLNEEQASDNPDQDGDRWLYFRIEDGTEGWLREIDVNPYEE
jgi:hypothetical protein